MTDPGEISAGALERLAIFPLPDVVFFPHALLPLHVFEPRYRALMEHVLAGDRVIAVPRLRPGYEADYQGRPEVFEVAGVGELVYSDRLPDGRYNIMLRGLGRVRLEAELPPERPFRLARGRLLADMGGGGPALAPTQRELIALCDRLAAAVPGGESLRELARQVPTPGGCADAVASALVRDPDARQGLLEQLDPGQRLDRVIEHVATLLRQMSKGAGSPPN